MSHKVHPYSFRLGILRDWRSRWFGVDKSGYRDQLKTDVMLRAFLEKKLKGNYISSVEMERNRNSYKIIIKSSKPGLIIGRNGEGATRLKDEVLKFQRKNNLSLPKEFKIEVEEIRSPESQASIVGQMIAEGLQKRLSFNRVMKQAIEKVMANRDVVGVKITLSGRLGGAEMGRTETLKKGRLPLQTLRADIDFARERASLPYGDMGIKVWIYRGDIFEQAKKD